MMINRPSSRRRLAAAGGLLTAVALSFCLAGCGQTAATHVPYKPAKVGAATAAGVKPVTFTAEGARRIGLERAPSLMPKAGWSLTTRRSSMTAREARGSTRYQSR